MSQLFQELKRRNVFRVAIAYLAVAWVVLQVADIVFESVAAPGWLMQVLLFFIAIGFIFALFFAWAFEMTPDGIKKEADVDRSISITNRTGKKLDRVIIGVLAIAVIFLLLDRNTSSDSAEIAETTERSVAVLPFVAMSGGPDDEYFTDGLTEEILNSLTRVQGLLVTARTSAFHFKGQDLPIPEIAKTLGVAHVVEGSVRREGNHLRVTAQLIRASDGFHLWSENYDRDSGDLFNVQTDIAEKIATALGVVLDDEQREKMHAAGLKDPEAFVAYQKAQELYNLAHGAGILSLTHLAKANELLDTTLALAPNLSHAHRIYTDLYAHTLTDAASGEDISAEDQQRAYESMVASYDAAIATAVGVGQRLTTAYDKALLTGQWKELAPILDEVLLQNECVDLGWLDPMTVPFGRAEQFRDFALRFAECDPLSYSGWRSAINASIWMGDTEGAIKIAETGREKVDHVSLTNTLVNALVQAGRFDEAESLVVRDVTNASTRSQLRIVIAAAQGDRQSSESRLQEYVVADDVDVDTLIPTAAIVGDRELANRLAAEFDARPYGYLLLMLTAYDCKCGAPFDLDVAPNFALLIKDAGVEWPPASPIKWPLKDW